MFSLEREVIFTAVYEDEQIDDLMLGGLKLIQKKDGFKFGVDAVILADFAALRKDALVCELGTGSGIVSLLCAHHYGVCADAVEIMPDYADMASRSVAGNALSDRINIHNIDLKNAPDILGKDKYDCVISNPPYKRVGAGADCERQDRACSRTELCATLDDVVHSASLLLKGNGKFVMVHRPYRLSDVILTMAKYKFHIKKLRFVCSKQGEAPVLMLIEARKHAKSDVQILPDLVLYNDDGSETEKTRKIYRRQQHDN